VVLALLGAALASLGTRKLPDWALARRDDARCPLTEGTNR
jgi:hypothetical protein